MIAIGKRAGFLQPRSANTASQPAGPEHCPSAQRRLIQSRPTCAGGRPSPKGRPHVSAAEDTQDSTSTRMLSSGSITVRQRLPPASMAASRAAPQGGMERSLVHKPAGRLMDSLWAVAGPGFSARSARRERAQDALQEERFSMDFVRSRLSFFPGLGSNPEDKVRPTSIFRTVASAPRRNRRGGSKTRNGRKQSRFCSSRPPLGL